MIEVPSHLGGHKGRTHTDDGLLDWCWNHLGACSVIDIGCGPGGQVHLAVEKGWEAHGVDGDNSIARRFDCEIFDFTTGIYTPHRVFDLAWCVEFLEHVEEKFIPNFMPAFQCARWAIITHALPGEVGHHHVNCQPSEYWIEQFSHYQFEYSAELTSQIRLQSSMKRDFVRRRGLFFVNQSPTIGNV